MLTVVIYLSNTICTDPIPQCTHNGWEGCATKARTLLDQRSEENRDFSQCLIDAKQTREQNINLQLGDLLDNDQVGSTLNKKGSEDLNENGDSKDNKVVIAEPPCTINKTQKVRVWIKQLLLYQ